LATCCPRDEAGLEIAGCWHGLAKWVVNMYHHKLYGYVNYIQVKKMKPKLKRLLVVLKCTQLEMPGIGEF